MKTDLTCFSATELVAAYRDKSVSPVEALRAVLARLDQQNERLNAFCFVNAETGLAMAQASEERWAREAPRGLLDGVPVSIKDTNLTVGWPTRSGSLTADVDQAWKTDHPAVARLREHGAVFFGKTTSPEFGWKGVTDSPLTGITRNPWNTERTPGGSSGGSAAALAAGIAPLATGGDGGGSIRIPCAFTGLFGLKTTYGVVPNLPNSLGTMGVPGPMARNTLDCALMLNVIAGPDDRDPFAIPDRTIDYTARLDEGIAGWRIGYSPRLGFGPCHPEVAAAVAGAAKAFEGLGAIVEEVDLDLSMNRSAFDLIWRAGFAESVLRLPPAKLAAVEPALRDFAESARSISATALQHAFEERIALSVQMQTFHRSYDLLLTPTLPIPAFEAGQLTPDPVRYPAWYDWTPFTWPFNMTRQPAASCPCGFTVDGLPIGLQIVGPLFQDERVLQASSAFEASGFCPARRPPFQVTQTRSASGESRTSAAAQQAS